MDFTKGIATEVRFLLQEIGKLRDERRQLQAYVQVVSDMKAHEVDLSDYEGKYQSLCRLGPSSAPTVNSNRSGGFLFLYVQGGGAILTSAGN